MIILLPKSAPLITLYLATSLAAQSATITVSEVGGDILFVSDGEPLDLNGLVLTNPSALVFTDILPSVGNFVVGAPDPEQAPNNFVSVSTYQLPGATPLPFPAFGAMSPPFIPTTASGPALGFFFDSLVLPLGYVSGSPLQPSQSTISSEDFASTGISPGLYTASWGPLPTQSLSLNVIPEPATTLLSVAGIFLCALRRKRS